MTATAISCEKIQGVVAWLLVYAGIPLPLILTLLGLWFPSSLRLPDVCLTSTILFGISPIVIWVAHDLYANRLISRNMTTIQQIKMALLQIEASRIKNDGPDIVFTEEELVKQFPSECREYVKYAIHQMRD